MLCFDVKGVNFDAKGVSFMFQLDQLSKWHGTSWADFCIWFLLWFWCMDAWVSGTRM